MLIRFVDVGGVFLNHVKSLCHLLLWCFLFCLALLSASYSILRLYLTFLSLLIRLNPYLIQFEQVFWVNLIQLFSPPFYAHHWDSAKISLSNNTNLLMIVTLLSHSSLSLMKTKKFSVRCISFHKPDTMFSGPNNWY